MAIAVPDHNAWTRINIPYWNISNPNWRPKTGVNPAIETNVRVYLQGIYIYICAL